MRLGRYAQAVAPLTRALHYARDNDELQLDLAQAQHHSGDLDGARQTLEKVLAASPHASVARVWLGHVQLQAGETEAAAASFAQVTPEGGATPADLAWRALGLAQLALMQGQTEAAVTALSEAAGYAIRDTAQSARNRAAQMEAQP